MLLISPAGREDALDHRHRERVEHEWQGNIPVISCLSILGDALRGYNPLLYRCFPLTCARSQE
jgi:hypothetical protein